MYISLYSFIMLLVLIITKDKCKTIMKSNIIFTTVWCFGAALSSLGLYDLYKPSWIIHLYSITAIVFFNFTFFICNKNYEQKFSFQELWKGKTRIKLIYVLNFVAWIYMLRFISTSINIISLGGLKMLRAYAYNSGMGLGSTVELLVASNIVQPIFEATMIITVLDYNINKEHPLMLIITFIDVAIYIISFGGRDIIIKLLFFYMAAFIIVRYSKINGIQPNKKKINVIFILTFFIIFSLLTQSRSWTETSIIKEIYYYCVGSFSYLQAIIQEGIKLPLLYGSATFGFIYNIIDSILTLLYKFKYNGSDFQIVQVTAQYRGISSFRVSNALTTMLYPLIRDFGYFGIVFGSSFLAWFVCFVENKYKERNSLFFLSMYIFLLYILGSSTMNYYLIFPGCGMIMIFLFIFVGNIKLKNK